MTKGLHTPAAILINPVQDMEKLDRKPDPGLLVKAMKTFGVYPSQTLYVSDVKIGQGAANRPMVDYCCPQTLFSA